MKKAEERNEPKKRWLMVTLLVPQEFGEVISNFLVEQGATGIEELEGDLERKKLRAYFPQDRKERKVLYALRHYLKSLEEIAPEVAHTQIRTASLPEQDWGENWKRFFKPIQVTPRFVVKPPWSKIRLKRGQVSIDITPGMAFGTGTHATTVLCIRALEERLKKKGLSVLDVGTGSGILSIIAAELGAKEVWGIDIDGVALENARENVKKNHVSNHLKNRGFLILSGILEKEKERLRKGYLKTELLQWIKVTQEGEWACLTFKRKKES
jgi:ribosomal protein L11 methyltransferase